jgi:hypothetical protein
MHFEMVKTHMGRRKASHYIAAFPEHPCRYNQMLLMSNAMIRAAFAAATFFKFRQFTTSRQTFSIFAETQNGDAA